ncbi:MAG: DUF1028 domain-containing protein [Flavobacteriales bacterium]|nr:DUF1028 domain-containing protein [Flavobacteriales bacterium]
MKKTLKGLFPFLGFLFCSISPAPAQDTFSIVAIDSVTGEVGSAGASCVDLFQTTINDDHFLGKLFPGIGAINTQAAYLQANQDSASSQMMQGKTPQQILKWLVENDAGGIPEFRQYGVVRFVNGSPRSAAYSGISTLDYSGHITGPNYSIQGNILKGKEVLDSMEIFFLRHKGDLACKLMAAMQGANMIGADKRCASNGTSSLFAFIKVAKPTDTLGSPSFVVSVRTANNSKIEPIDSLQNLFNAVHNCSTASVDPNKTNELRVNLFPNPAQSSIQILSNQFENKKAEYHIYNNFGQKVQEGKIENREYMDISELKKGIYTISIEFENTKSYQKFLKL